MLEEGLLADAAKLRGVKLDRLGYYGGIARQGAITLAHTLNDEELEPFYDTEPERAAAEQKARLLAGCLWKCSNLLIEGLFTDIHELRRIEGGSADPDSDRAKFIAKESVVLHRLPRTYRRDYTADFAQRFLVVAADMTTKLASKWTEPSCTAQEIAVHLLAKVTEAYGKQHRLDLDSDVPGALYEALLEDIDFLFIYDGPSVRTSVAIAAVGAANMDFNDWFEPFNPDRGVSPYANYKGIPRRPDGEGDDGWDEDEDEPESGEEVAPEAREQAIADGRLIDVTDMAEDCGFNCPVAITRKAYDGHLGGHLEGAKLTREGERKLKGILGSAVRAAAAAPERRSGRFFVMGQFDPSVDIDVAYLDVVAGSAGPGVPVVTIQVSRRQS
ncbi:MAG TPA: DUF6573 family protein [Arthrobacter sp.]